MLNITLQEYLESEITDHYSDILQYKDKYYTFVVYLKYYEFTEEYTWNNTNNICISLILLLI